MSKLDTGDRESWAGVVHRQLWGTPRITLLSSLGRSLWMTLALTPSLHNPSKAPWSFLGLLRPTRRGGGHLLTPSSCLPPLPSLETGKNTWLLSLCVCFSSRGCLRALVLLVTSLSAVFEHPQLLCTPGTKLGCEAPLRAERPSLGSNMGLKGSVSWRRPHTLPGSRLCSRS